MIGTGLASKSRAARNCASLSLSQRSVGFSPRKKYCLISRKEELHAIALQIALDHWPGGQ